MIRLPRLVIGYTRIRSRRGGCGITNACTSTPSSLKKRLMLKVSQS